MDEIAYREAQEGRATRAGGFIWRFGDRFMDVVDEDWGIISRQYDLFLGALLFFSGLLDFHSGKYCDGNTADYLSCTRPVTFYYYTWLEMILIILGAMFILLWFMKRDSR